MLNKVDRRPPPPSEDKLDAIRAALRTVRDLELANSDMERAVKENKKALAKLQHEDLPDLFTTSQIRDLTLEAEGNLPAYRAALHPYFKAGISSDWDEGRRVEAFAALQEAGGGDLIKNVITIELDPGNVKMADRIKAGLTKMGVAFSAEMSVHWKTLTAFVQEQYQAKPPRTLPLEKLGATVGRKVSIKPLTGG